MPKKIKHEHNWIILSEVDRESHTPPNKYIVYTFKQICECGAYQYKTFTHIDDLQVKGDVNE